MLSCVEGYTRWSTGRNPEQIIGVLDELFVVFDDICEECGLLKVKTIGDCYMAVAGCLQPEDPDISLLRATVFAWDCMEVRQKDILVDENEGVSHADFRSLGRLCGTTSESDWAWSKDARARRSSRCVLASVKALLLQE